MPIVSVCPYCSRGRVRASEEAIGTTAKCPACGSEFTVIPADEPVASAAGTVPSVFATESPSKPRPVARLPEPSPEPTVSDDTPVPAEPVDAPDPDDLPDPARLPALVAVAVGLGGIVAWAIPDFGRLVWLGLAVVALVAAGLSWLAADRRRVFAWVALGVTGGSLLLCLALPALLGEGWWPVRGYNQSEAVAVGIEDGTQSDGRKPVDATKADWMRDGVRVRLLAVRREPVAVRVPAAGPGKKPTTKKTDEVLQVVIEVANDASPMPLAFGGWADGTATLTTAAGQGVPAKQFDGGATPADAPPPGGKPTAVTTGLTARQTLYFVPPPGDAGGRGTLELSPAAFGGGGDPIRLYVPLQPYTRGAK